MALFKMLCDDVLISIRRKKYYSMHYKMWDFIVAHLQSDSDEFLSDAEYITTLKRIFIKTHYNRQVFLSCFLCDLYYGTHREPPKCTGCPLYKLCGVTCLSNSSPFRKLCNRKNKRAVRIEAAKMIRDCVLMEGGK